MPTATSKRILEVDWLRSIAIALMVYTHVAIYFYDYQNPIFSWFSDLGGTICFTLFLFAAGCSIGILNQKLPVQELARNLARRGAIFYLLFVLLAVLASRNLDLIGIITLKVVPDLTDFILAFAYFFLIGAGLVYLLKRGLKLNVLLAFSVLLYPLGYVLYFVNVDPALVPIKAILVGHEDLHRFPILQYLFIFVLGMALIEYYSWFMKLSRLVVLTAASLILYLVVNQYFGFYRWSAAPGFISYGLIWIWGLLTVYAVLKAKFPPSFTKLFTAISTSSASVLVVHLVVLLTLSKIELQRTNGFVATAITFLLVFVGGILRKQIRL